MGTALEVVNRFYAATNGKQVDALKAIVAPNVSFTGPVMHAAGADEYLQMNAQLLPFHRAIRMLAQFEREHEVCSLYEMDMETPAGGQITVTLADWIQVEDGRIVEQRIFFDPRAFATAFGLEDSPASTQ